MKFKHFAAAVAANSLTASMALAEVPIAAVLAPTGTVLRAGTAVPIRLLTSLTTEGKHPFAGDRFDI